MTLSTLKDLLIASKHGDSNNSDLAVNAAAMLTDEAARVAAQVTQVSNDLVTQQAIPYEALHFKGIGPFSATNSTAGVVSTAAMALWGLCTVPSARTISHIDFHQTKDGSGGSAVVEVWRRRGTDMTLLATLTITQGGGDFSEDDVIPAGALALLEAHDYLYAQGITAPTGGAGFAIDIHF